MCYAVNRKGDNKEKGKRREYGGEKWQFIGGECGIIPPTPPNKPIGIPPESDITVLGHDIIGTVSSEGVSVSNWVDLTDG